MSALQLNREELLRDSEATLRKVAGVLDDFWNLRSFEAHGSGCRAACPSFSGPAADVAHLLASTHREVQALQEGIGALHALLPVTAGQRDPRSSSDPVHGTMRMKKATRASEILAEVQSRLDRLAHDTKPQGLDME